VWSQAQAELKQARDDIQDHETRLRTIEARVLSGLASIDGRLANLEGKTP
jgi:outer membrane protein TolC